MARSFSMKLCNFRAFTFNVGAPLRRGPLTFVLFQRFLVPRYGVVLFTLLLWAFLENVFSQPVQRRLLRHFFKKGTQKEKQLLSVKCNDPLQFRKWLVSLKMPDSRIICSHEKSSRNNNCLIIKDYTYVNLSSL